MSFADLFRKKEPTRFEIGKFGESKAARFLKKNGYKIIGTNVHAGNSEIDIIASKGTELVFVEVKTRTYSEDTLTRPADAVNRDKEAYLIRGANRFCSENSDRFASFTKRIDIIEVYLEKNKTKTLCKEIRHFENAIKCGR